MSAIFPLQGMDPATVDFRVSASWPALRRALAIEERFSFILIDAVHTAKCVTQDLAWSRMLEVGDLIALHDCGPMFLGVVWARRFLKKHSNHTLIAAADTLVVLKKVKHSAFPEVSTIDSIFAEVVDVPFHWRRSIAKRLGRDVFAPANNKAA